MRSKEVPRVIVEILRGGRAGNQLLSPLTPYLAICGDQAGPFHVPWEHARFLRALREFRGAKVNAVGDELKREMGELFGRLPGFISALANHAGKELIHVELVLTAAELALLPLEVAANPERPQQYPALLLQDGPKVVMTRRIRGAPTPRGSWPRRPKTLFISAAPEGLRVPAERHLDGILAALGPSLPKPLSAGYRSAVDDHLTVCHCATLARVVELCSENQYGFVHILAHGRPDKREDGAGIGLALHSPEGGEQIVSGAELARALQSNGSGPMVVSLASCDSGAIGDVVYSSGSLAHDLHAHGIPLVVGSQFPLSFRGSVAFVDTLYPGLLEGVDPRLLLWKLRRRLSTLDTCDWAGLVAYASLSDDLLDEWQRPAPSIVASFVSSERAKLSKLTDSPSASNVPIDSATSLSLITWATREAHFVVSVDYELKSWAYIIDEDDLRGVVEALKGGRGRTADVPPLRDRLDDFENLYRTMEQRLIEPDESDVPLVPKSPAIVRTFVLEAANSAADLTVEEWCILKRLKRLEDCAKAKRGLSLMVNKILFLKGATPEARQRESRNGDVILFLRQHSPLSEAEEWPPSKLPSAFEAYGIRERQQLRPGAGMHVFVTSEVVGNGAPMRSAYADAVASWRDAVEIDPDGFLAQMRAKGGA